jgi:Glycosyl transferase family 2
LVEKVEHQRDLSVVVVVYNVPREAPRTLWSLSAGYQRHIEADDYEVIVVDNGSNPPFDAREIEGLAGNFRLIRIDPAQRSPAQAVNRGLAEARGEIIGVMIDGARIVTPGLLHFARLGSRFHATAVVAAPGWYLGYDFQRWAMRYGYDQTREDALLDSIEWPSDGYRLFEIGTMDESSIDGWFQPIAESNALFMRRTLWHTLGGLDERFDAPGGGLVNLDVHTRALELPEAQPVLLLGEGTFHQLHGGVATNSSPEQIGQSYAEWDDQYERLRGHRFMWPKPEKSPIYVGTLHRSALTRFVRSAVAPLWPHHEPPLGCGFDQQLWSPKPPELPSDPTLAAVVDLAHQEFRSGRYGATVGISRLIRSRAPDEPEPQRLLSLTALEAKPSGPDYYLALAEAYRLLGEPDAAADNYRTALTFNRDLSQAHLGLAALSMPGDNYLVWLDRLYRSLAPEIVLEIGVYRGESLAVLRPPTVAIGVGANPTVCYPLKTETHIFAETSDEFFAQGRLERLLAGRPLSVAFIDGLHLYEQVLREFISLEAFCGQHSVLLIHDTVPLDESTQSRVQETQFYTGDVWKAVLCLKHFRPDLDVFTIATPPTGLTVVTGLDPTSLVLRDRYEEAVARFFDTPFSAIEGNSEALNVIPNDWSVVLSRLKERQVIRS